MGTIWLLIFIQAFICGILSMTLADHKGYPSGGWFIIGFILGIFGLIAAAGLPVKALPPPPVPFAKKCPDCTEMVSLEARVCKFCGNKFSKEQIVADAIKFIELVPVASSSDRMLNEALNCLSGSPNPGLVSQLSDIIRKTKSNIKANKLLEVLGSFADPSSIAIVVDSLQKPERRDSAAIALQKFGNSALPSLEQFAAGAKRAEKKLAEQIITKIKQTDAK